MDEPRLKGKVALVTGGGTGIGRAVARAYAGEGATVWICGRRRDPLAEAVAEIRHTGGEADFGLADVGEANDLDALGARIAGASGRLDILVNNAAILGPTGPLAEASPDEWDEVLRVNLTGAYLAVRAFLPLFRRSGSGSIINVTSGLGRHGRAGWGPYAVSKFGIEGLTQVLADDLKPLGIRVNAVNPGGTRTRMRAAAFPDEDPAALTPPDCLAPLFIWLASDASRGATGRSIDAPEWRVP